MQIGKKNNTFEQKVEGWKSYAKMLDDVMDKNPGMDPKDKITLSNYKEDIYRGIDIRKACQTAEKAGVALMQASWIGAIPAALLMPGNIAACAIMGTFMTGAALLTGGIITASKHPDQLVAGMPGKDTLEVIGKYVAPYIQNRYNE